MKKIWVALISVAIVAGLFFIFRSKNPAPPSPVNAAVSNVTAIATIPGEKSATPATAKNPESISSVTAANAGSTLATGLAVATPAPNPTVPPMEISSLPPLTILDNARVVMKNYDSEFGGNPVGTNPEITEALMGKNPKGITFITPESGLRVNEQGEMVDAWGTPFFFHQVSGHEMEIRSAGQDRKMWTPDDLVTR